MQKRCVNMACMALAAALHLGPEAAAQEPPSGGGEPAREKPAGDDVDALAQGAQQAFDEGRLEDAQALLSRAWELRQAYDIAGNLGIVELKLGRAPDAAEHLDFALRHFPPTEDAALRAGLQEKLGEARGQVGAVAVRVRPEGAEVRVNGRRVEPRVLERGVFVGAGAVTIAARRDGFLPAERTLRVERGGRVEATLDLPAAAMPPAPQPEPPPLWPAAALGVAGVLGLGVGAGLMLAGGAEGSDAEALHDALMSARRSCATGAATYDARCPELDETTQRADALHNAGLGLFIGGGVALAGAGGYLAWREGQKGERTPAAAVRVAPWAGASGAGLRAVGWF